MPRKKQAKELFDDNEEFDDHDGSPLPVNEEYAKRFEHNARRAELHRLKEKHPEQYARLQARGALDDDEDGQEESSTSEDEDDGYIAEDTEAQILETLKKLRRKDPEIYDPTKHFFAHDNDDDAEEEEEDPQPKRDKKMEKPMLLKDVLFQQRVKEAAGEASTSDEDDERSHGRHAAAPSRPRQVYDKEQEALRSSFLQAVQGDDDDDGLLIQKKTHRNTDDAASDGENDSKVTHDNNKVTQKLLEEVFDPEDDRDRFLKQYIASKAWMQEEDEEDVRKNTLILGDEDALEEDEEFEQQAEEFEHQYNFRYMEPGGTTVATHPRTVASVRKADTRRAEQRKRRQERKEQEEAERREELKRLKNLKRQEIEEKLTAIQEVAGRPTAASEAVDDDILGQLLQGDFDPVQYDALMAKAFGEEYYDAEVEEDEEELAALVKDEIQGEEDDDNDDNNDNDDLLEEEEDHNDQTNTSTKHKKHHPPTTTTTPKDTAPPDGPLTFKSLRKRLRAEAQLAGSAESTGGGDTDGAEHVARSRADVQKLLEEYYKLDYEDHVGGVYTRFRYKQVPANNFGLDVQDVLSLEDRQLNQIVSLKKLAPYREDADLIQPNYKMLRKFVGKKKQSHHGTSSVDDHHDDHHENAASMEVDPLSKRKTKKRKHVQEHDAAQEDTVVQEHAAVHQATPPPAEAPAKKKKKKNKGAAKEEPLMSPQEARRASYAKPGTSLRNKNTIMTGKHSVVKNKGEGLGKDGGGATGDQGEKQWPEGTTKAQRKNLKRAQKRAEARKARGGDAS